MEKRIIQKVQSYEKMFKDDIKEWIQSNGMIIIKNNSQNHDMTSDMLKFIYDYNSITFNKEDFQKRKRTKNLVPHYELCRAKKANGNQCTRRKKIDCCYCGTHIKGTPHGIIENTDDIQKIQKVEVWVQEIKGINYYIDSNNNVYKSEDIISNKHNPNIIAKWILEDSQYKIPAFNI